MNKLCQYRYNFHLLIIAVVCTAGRVPAQQSIAGSQDLPIIVDRKQAAALVLAQSTPEYPPIAKVNYVEGQVQLELTVDSKGKVASAHVLNGIAILAESALKATRWWTYRPLATASGPSGFITTVKVRFTLKAPGTQLTARQAERDFLSRVKPAEAVRPAQDAQSGEVVRMRVLVNDQGQVVDMGVPPTNKARFETACEILRRWTFHPAHWGALPIASYLNVDIPIGAPPVTQAAAGAISR